MTQEILAAINVSFGDTGSLRRFDVAEIPEGLLSIEDLAFLRDAGLPSEGRDDIQYNGQESDFARISSLVNYRRDRMSDGNELTVIARGLDAVFGVSAESRKVYLVYLERDYADEVVNSSLPQFIASRSLFLEYSYDIEQLQHDYDAVDARAVSFLRSLRALDPEAFSTSDNYWESKLVAAGFGEKIDWR
ncbi:MAG: SUKH-4 family immunity protein [Pirellulales bacterium]|nr:SUKH-4 family immunity protein [Pirellulales bacterium]